MKYFSLSLFFYFFWVIFNSFFQVKKKRGKVNGDLLWFKALSYMPMANHVLGCLFGCLRAVMVACWLQLLPFFYDVRVGFERLSFVKSAYTNASSPF